MKKTYQLCFKIQDAFIDEDEVEDDKSKKKEAKVTKNSSRRSTRTQSSIIFTQVESQTRVDPLVEECNWFESHLKNNSKLVENADVVEVNLEIICKPTFYFSTFIKLLSCTYKPTNIPNTVSSQQ